MQSDVEFESAREVDQNGFVIVRDNPVIRAGVFPYKGSMIGHGADPNQTYNVLRPLEELTKEETIASFIGKPIIDDHQMLGEKYEAIGGERQRHGSILENVRVVGNDVLAPISIFSRTLKALLDAGKRGLSLGYNCRFEKSVGEFAGVAYTYIQKDIRVNHLALVTQGRNGTAVLDEQDVYDHFDLALDTQETTMADEKTEKKEEKSEAKDEAAPVEKAEMNLKDVHGYMKKHAPMWKELQTMMASESEDDDGEAMDDDTKEKPGDQAKDEKECKDEKEEKKEAMDAADVNSLLDKRLGGVTKSLKKAMIADAAAKVSIVAQITPHIGTFACDAMDADEVAAYGAEKLGLDAPKGQERTAINAYLKDRKAPSQGVTYAMDGAFVQAKTGGKLAGRLAERA